MALLTRSRHCGTRRNARFDFATVAGQFGQDPEDRRLGEFGVHLQDLPLGRLFHSSFGSQGGLPHDFATVSRLLRVRLTDSQDGALAFASSVYLASILLCQEVCKPRRLAK